jgi:hypothetical protein
VENVHYPQYALIAFLIGRAGIAPELAWLAATGLGALDEAHQLFFLRSARPDYFDWNDVFLNAVGAAYGVVLLLAGSRHRLAPSVSGWGVRGVIALAIAVALLLQSPSVSPYFTITLRGNYFRILSALEGIILLAALWWTLRRMLTTQREAADQDLYSAPSTVRVSTSAPIPIGDLPTASARTPRERISR